ncbi:response regulator transcription factor [Chitinophaga filiformis]|uniref:response regulator transcription factor n=1 Tax=Chitinophaga filiformis TaxID=104663 RepID=UPI001F4770B6|nr:response regulator transcription factor [Chitinophaga filiformis]MCF6407799.1 response regulator transcription factor [Chitinophaga filiformis]
MLSIQLNRKYQIGIIEDDIQFSDDLILHISQTSHFSTCLNTNSTSNAFRILYNHPTLNPDLLLLSTQAADAEGLEEIKEFKELKPEMLVVLLTKEENKHIIRMAFDQGADGYLMKTENFYSLERKIIHMLEYGQPAMSQQIFRYMLFRNKSDKPVKTDQLTRKEQEIIEMVLEGMSYKEVAAGLHLSLNTIQYHMKNIFLKLDIKTKTELFKIYYH